MSDIKWYSMDEVAEHLGISRDTLLQHVKKGLPAYKFGGKWRFDINEVDQWIKENCSEKNN